MKDIIIYCPRCGHEIEIRYAHDDAQLDGKRQEETAMPDEQLREEFSERVRVTKRAAVQLARPWKITTGILAAAVVALTLLNRR